MRPIRRSPFLPLCLLGASLGAWTPKLHEVQTSKAVKMVPKRMAALLRAYPEVLLEAARGQGNDQPPTVEEVDSEFRTIVRMSQEPHTPQELVREFGALAHLVQALNDPSCTSGVTPLREVFEAYAEEKLPRLVVSRAAFWAVSGPTNPKPKLDLWMAEKMRRNQELQPFVDPATGKRAGAWDDLSIPFAQLQLSFSGSVNATANIWILLYREVGDLWPQPEASPRDAKASISD